MSRVTCGRCAGKGKLGNVVCWLCKGRGYFEDEEVSRG